MATRIFHMCIDIRGVLRWPNNRLPRICRAVDDSRWATADETREWLMDQLAEGKCVLPIGKACDGFSYEHGCPGHDAAEASTGDEP